MTETWIILGASSAMGRAFARKVASQGANVILAGRNKADMAVTAIDCQTRGAAEAEAVAFDIRKPASFEAIYSAAQKQGGVINAAVFVGSMSDQSDVDSDPAKGTTMATDSFVGPMEFLHGLAPIMEAREGGVVIGVGSVAGDRGRLSNYSYGAAKAGFHTYLAGLRNRLTRFGGHVVTVKPGFVDTAMTWGLPGLFLVATPDKVADDLWNAAQKRKNTLYTPWFWAYIMLIIKMVPERIFKKLSI